MNASSTLLAALTPAIPELEARFSDPGATSGRLASADSFLSLMAQARHDKIAVGPENASILQSAAPEAGAPAAHVTTSVASSRVAVMVQPPAASVSPSAQAVKPRVTPQTVQLPAVPARPPAMAQAGATLKNPLQAVEESTAPIQDDEPSDHRFNKPASAPAETPKNKEAVAQRQTPPATPTATAAETPAPLPAPTDTDLSMLIASQLSALGFNKSDFSLVKTNIVESKVETKPAAISSAPAIPSTPQTGRPKSVIDRTVSVPNQAAVTSLPVTPRKETSKSGIAASADLLTAPSLKTKPPAIARPGASVKTAQTASDTPAILSTPQTGRSKSVIGSSVPVSNQTPVAMQPTTDRKQTRNSDATAPGDPVTTQSSTPPGTHSKSDPSVAAPVPVSIIPAPALSEVRSAVGPGELHPLAITPMVNSSGNAALPASPISSGKIIAPSMADWSSKVAVSLRAAADNTVSNTRSNESSQSPASKPPVITNDAAAPVASTPLPSAQHEDMPLVIKPSEHATAKAVESTKESTAKTPEPALSLSEPAKTAATATVSPANSNDGTAGAFNGYRMDFSAEKNEIAEPAAQKVPGASPKEASSAKAGNALSSSAESARPGAKTATVDSPQVINLSDKTGDRTLDLGKGAAVAPAAAQSATQIERLGQMVNQHVTMMHQSGANNMAVSLKLDPQTELNLQLTNHNGQIEASVSVGRGTVTGMDGHWKELQESLARQNVQLLPLENKTAARTPSFNAGPISDNSSSSTFRQPSQNSQRHNRDAQPNLPWNREAVGVSATDKSTSTKTASKGWESWA